MLFTSSIAFFIEGNVLPLLTQTGGQGTNGSTKGYVIIHGYNIKVQMTLVRKILIKICMDSGSKIMGLKEGGTIAQDTNRLCRPLSLATFYDTRCNAL